MESVTMGSDEEGTPRRPLTRQRVLEAAVDVADRAGLDALTMRRLGAELGVEAMSLYKHVAGKDEILDGIVELVIGEIDVPTGSVGWREAMRRRAASARQVLGRHSWAIGLLEARGATGPAALRYVDAILGTLRSAGFSLEDAAHAFWLLDSYVYGHVVQETSLPTATSEEMAPPDADGDDVLAGEYPHLAELAGRARTIGFSADGEFEFGLELVLDALERRAASLGPPAG